MAKITQIIIGDEILSGKIADLNLKFMAQSLLSTGHKFLGAKFIGDDEHQMLKTFEQTSLESDVMILTGGLGPTKDDLTKDVLGKWLGTKMQESDQAREMAIKQYTRMNRQWNSELNNYHLLPEGITAIYNPIGFAPGLFLKKNDCLIFAAPGVPREFQGMLKDTIMPIIDQEIESKDSGLEIFNIRTFGIPEEMIFGKLCPNLWEDLEEFGKVSSLPNLSGVDITMRLMIDEKLEEKKEAIKKIINNSSIKDNIWHIGMMELNELIVKEACEKKLTISFAESCTGGLVSSMITDISGSSACFLGAVVSYANEVKINQLSVSEKIINDHGAVSIEVAKQMAIGARDNLKSDIAISFTGIAGPGGGSENKPVGTVAIGWSTKNESDSTLYHFSGERIRLKQRFATTGLFKLLMLIRSL